MALQEERAEIKEFFKWIFGKRFNELSLYIMSISCVLIYWLDNSFYSLLHSYLSNTEDFRVYIVLLGILLGIYYSIFHAFSKREKTKFQKSSMLYFAMTLQLIVASVTIIMSLEIKEVSFLFALINYLNAHISYILFDKDIINEDDIDDGDITILEVIISTIIITTVIFISTFYLKTHWIETLSISIVLANQAANISHKVSLTVINQLGFK